MASLLEILARVEATDIMEAFLTPGEIAVDTVSHDGADGGGGVQMVGQLMVGWLTMVKGQFFTILMDN